MVSIWGSHLDKDDGILWDISPSSIGNLESYPENILEFHSLYDYFNGGDAVLVLILILSQIKNMKNKLFLGDYTRVLAEFWADGPDSETPQVIGLLF